MSASPTHANNSNNSNNNNNKRIEAYFYPGNARGPYVRDFYSITLDPSANTGQIEFNGYFYVNQEELPTTEKYLSVVEEEWIELETPIEREEPVFNLDTMREDGTRLVKQTHTSHRRRLHRLRIRITHKEEFEDTSEYWDEPDVGMMCAFPTNRLRLTFDILPPSPLPEPLPPISKTLDEDEDVIDLE